MDSRLTDAQSNAPTVVFNCTRIFDTRDDAKQYISSICNDAGITVVQGPSNCKRTEILCDRNGLPQSESKGLRKASSRKCNCPFKLFIRRRKQKKTEDAGEGAAEDAAEENNTTDSCSYTFHINVFNATITTQRLY